MKLHIIRHAEAVGQSAAIPDGYRYLSCQGRTRFRRVADILKKCGIDQDIMFSSPLVRAVQTAETAAADNSSKISLAGDRRRQADNEP